MSYFTTPTPGLELEKQNTSLVGLAEYAASFRVSKNNPSSSNVFDHRRTAIIHQQLHTVQNSLKFLLDLQKY